MAVIIDELQLLLCIFAIIVSSRLLALSLSIGSLGVINSLAHIGACVHVRRYALGVISGTLPYFPLGSYAFYTFAASGQLTLAQTAVSVILGMLFLLVPIAYFFLGSLFNRLSPISNLVAIELFRWHSQQ